MRIRIPGVDDRSVWEERVRDRVAEAFSGHATDAGRQTLAVLGITEPEDLLPLLRTVDLARFRVSDSELAMLRVFGLDRDDVLLIAAEEFLTPTR